MMSVEHNYPRNMTEFPMAFLSDTFWTHKESGAPQSKKPLEYTMQLPNGTTIFKEQILSQGITTNHLLNFLMEKNTNNRVNRWGLELATYNITFEWISRACNKAAD